jgi:hypothetical protein
VEWVSPRAKVHVQHQDNEDYICRVTPQARYSKQHLAMLNECMGLLLGLGFPKRVWTTKPNSKMCSPHAMVSKMSLENKEKSWV